MEKLKISENKRYFETSDGKPFSWIADTDWTMPQRISFHDVDYFMKKRKNQGFTVLQIVALDPEADTEIRNPAGQKALLDNNLLTPNEKYFEYLDYIIDKAEEYGFYVLLLPIWGQLVVGHNWMGEFSEKTMTADNAYQYGKWIGNRYKNKKNILWCLGGDRQPIHLKVDYRPVWRLLAEGIAKGVLDKDLKANEKNTAWEELLITYHACYEQETGECSTFSYWTDDEAWINFIMIQSGHGLTPKNYELIKKEYGRENTMPVWDGEPAYEMMPTSWPEITNFHGSWMVRKRAYWAILAGAFGHTYGHCSVWCSVSEKERSKMSPYTWYEALHGEGAEQMRVLRAFMDDIQPMTYSPCQYILPEENEKAELDQHVQASVNQTKDTICAYLPSGGAIRLNVKKRMGEEVFVWWYNTRDGKFYDNKNLETLQELRVRVADNGNVELQAPTAGEEQDWLLIMKKESGKCPINNHIYYELEEQVELKKVFEW